MCINIKKGFKHMFEAFFVWYKVNKLFYQFAV